MSSFEKCIDDLRQYIATLEIKVRNAAPRAALLRARLDEATGLLREELEGYPPCMRRDTLEAFLSRAPAQPAVPEPSESAESQIAAVREAANNQALTPHQRWERIMLVLTQPTPGAGTGEDQ